MAWEQASASNSPKPNLTGGFLGTLLGLQCAFPPLIFYIRADTVFVMSNEEEEKGKAKQVKGKIQETTGNLTDNKEWQAKGKIEKAKGKAEEEIGKLKKKL